MTPLSTRWEAQAAEANQSLKAAFARLEEAHAQTRIARAAYFPSLTADAGATRTRTSLNSPTYFPGLPNPENDFTVGAALSYEIDLFGRVRNTVSGARASEQASAGDVAALELSVQAELAGDYFALRDRCTAGASRQNGDRLRPSAQAHGESVSRRRRRGIRRAASASAARDRAHPSRGHPLAPGANRARHRGARGPGSIQLLLARGRSTSTCAPAVDPGLPSQLLERRPDVSAAERRVASANASIGVARAAYFPTFSLAGALGLESTATSNWMQAPSRFWAIGPKGALPLSKGVLYRAQTAAARATYDEQVANYRASVLTAFQNVEDNLAALRQLERESMSETAAVAATKGAFDQAVLRYQGGLVTYLEVVSTENAALAARLSAVDIQTRRITTSVQLVKALGGDWRPATP